MTLADPRNGFIIPNSVGQKKKKSVSEIDQLQTQRVYRALHPVSGEDGILVAEVPRGVQHASSARTSPRRVVGLV